MPNVIDALYQVAPDKYAVFINGSVVIAGVRHRAEAFDLSHTMVSDPKAKIRVVKVTEKLWRELNQSPQGGTE